MTSRLGEGTTFRLTLPIEGPATLPSSLEVSVRLLSSQRSRQQVQKLGDPKGLVEEAPDAGVPHA